MIKIGICSENLFVNHFFFFFLQESFDTSKPITAADIHQVFENLAKKRKRN